MPLLFITYNSKSPLLLLLFLHNTPNHCMTEHLALVKKTRKYLIIIWIIFCSVEKDIPYQKEPKFIVFYTRLLAIFSMFCFSCKAEGPEISMKKNGTMVTVSQCCRNCGPNAFVWRSQPFVLGRYPVGNILLSFAILMAGASLSKILLVLKHMGMSTYSARTYFVHQSKFLFPAILTYWEQYRSQLVEEIKKQGRAIWCGDGRFDSIGHSAKYGAYTMFCCAVAKIVHFELVQVCCHLKNG